MLALGYGFYADWELRDKVTFDGPNKLIRVNEGVTALDIRIDVYSAWKRWTHASSDNSRFEQAIRSVGGDPTVGSQFAGDIYFLMNGWRLLLDFSLTAVTGILFSQDEDTAYATYANVPQNAAAISSTVNGITNTETVVNEASIIALQNSLDNLETNVDEVAIADEVATRFTFTDGRVDAALAGDAQVGLSPEQSAMLLELWKLAGLDVNTPMSVSPVIRKAGNDLVLQIIREGDDVTVYRQNHG